MTERSWRCLAHVVIGAGPMTFFPLVRCREFFGGDRIKQTLPENRKRQFVPPPDAWLHEPYAGNAGSAGVIPPSALLGEFSSSPARTSLVSNSRY
jgi:hypothetical protein